MDPHQPCEFHENRIKTATFIVTSFIYIYIFVIRDLQNEKRDHLHLPHSSPSEVEGVRIVVISFRNIAENQENKNKKGFFPILGPYFQLENPEIIKSKLTTHRSPPPVGPFLTYLCPRQIIFCLPHFSYFCLIVCFNFSKINIRYKGGK